MMRMNKKLSLKQQLGHLDTIQEANCSEPEDIQCEQFEMRTRENSCLDFQAKMESDEAQQLKTLLTLTSFEVQNTKRRVVQLVQEYDGVAQYLSSIKRAQLQILDVIADM
ncbi:Hypothetical_protein [Hexamita inflata]|uniref:Hypothetical_protein n=1 Tax=Hexamita inflata TaxID=28002 RepID=A0AA86PDD6_9EUKA|nr:Hypothetical protein HINF_LOCUS24117 [Hexamita inflata]